MAQAKAKKLALAALALLFGGASAVIVQQAFFKTREAKAVAQDKSAVAAPGLAESTAKETGKVLVFRGRPSWNRQPDFEDALVEMGIDFEVKPADLMDTADLSRYRAIVIPGAQSTSQFYTKYIENAERFDAYVTNGGVLLLELNGSERAGLPLPRGVQMVLSPALENTITLPQHPVMLPLAGRIIRANYASHGYLTGVPTNALVLATETLDGESVPDRPTFAEYTSGKGRVLAACQCFHDRDNSGRGPLMQTALRYATEQNWYAPKK